jgi:hypothetical protein
MADFISGRAPQRRPVSFIVPGDHVRIRAGELAGLIGVVVRMAERFNCFLFVDGLPKGVYLRTSLFDLERIGQ